MTKKIVVLDGYTLNPGDLSWKPLQNLGEVKIYERTPAEATLERSEGASIILTNKVVLREKLIDSLPDLEYIGVMATGYNVIDLEAAKRRNIQVSNIPSYSTKSVAQLVFAFILEFCNRVQKHADHARGSGWADSEDFSYFLTPQNELAGKKLGIYGWGEIGKAVGKIGEAFGMDLLICSDHLTDSQDGKLVSLEELFRESDFVSIHKALTPQLEEVINKDLLGKMKKSAYLINTSRGGIINEKDLADALNHDKIAGAGLDVLSKEPPNRDNPLLEAKNILITPHLAWATQEARTRAMTILVENVRSFLAGSPQNLIS